MKLLTSLSLLSVVSLSASARSMFKLSVSQQDESSSNADNLINHAEIQTKLKNSSHKFEHKFNPRIQPKQATRLVHKISSQSSNSRNNSHSKASNNRRLKAPLPPKDELVEHDDFNERVALISELDAVRQHLLERFEVRRLKQLIDLVDVAIDKEKKVQELLHQKGLLEHHDTHFDSKYPDPVSHKNMEQLSKDTIEDSIVQNHTENIKIHTVNSPNSLNDPKSNKSSGLKLRTTPKNIHIEIYDNNPDQLKPTSIKSMNLSKKSENTGNMIEAENTDHSFNDEMELMSILDHNDNLLSSPSSFV